MSVFADESCCRFEAFWQSSNAGLNFFCDMSAAARFVKNVAFVGSRSDKRGAISQVDLERASAVRSETHRLPLSNDRLPLAN